MHVTVLAVPGCPHLPVLDDRLTEALDGLPAVTVSSQLIATEEEAARCGMHGSPTILIDGLDPFAEPGQPASVSCRLYRDRDGRGRRRPLGQPAPPRAHHRSRQRRPHSHPELAGRARPGRTEAG